MSKHTTPPSEDTQVEEQHSSAAPSAPADQESDRLQAELAQAQEFLQKARESELRAMADYHNLVRRTQEERVKMAKLAALTFIEKLLQPMDHLFLAKEQLKDPGLNMVYQQFVDALGEEGLEVFDPMGQKFDVNSMEVVSKEKIKDEKQVDMVVKVMSRGYKLHGEVIQHAKVIVGEK
jgi:molecular chaperone GrpE